MTDPSLPKSAGIFDAALSDPDNDLLGISVYARRLAEFMTGLQPPFTIGVYGAWGSGKTTFVRFVEALLKQKVDHLRFITFEAWPFKTSDELWRALVQTIAQELYDVADEPQALPAADGDGSTEPFAVRVGRLLRKPAFYLTRETPPPPPNADYYELLRRLDDTFYGGVRPSSSERRTLDEEAALVTLVQGAVTMMGGLSPMIAAMRAFFGGDAKVDIAQLLKQEKDDTMRRRIQSVAEFRRVLRDLFETRAKGATVYVFIDDLDRCMPDVALDLLEALKIFLGETRCFFIVAADEQLIGEGLRIRYKELLEIAPTGETARLFARRGKEYFEKIIQLGIRVPEHSAQEVHTFIAAQFPQWLAATDLIQAAVGTNPRRLKQYCTWLTYKSMVARRSEKASQPEGDPHLLNKLIELQSWSPEVVKKLREIAREEDYAAIVERLEQCLRASSPDHPRHSADAETANQIALVIYQEAVMSTPLHRLFTTEPLLSTADPLEVAAMTSFVDVVPAPESSIMLRSGDPVMMRILDKITITSDVAPRTVVIDDMTKLFALAADEAAVVDLLSALASRDDWHVQLQAVEASLEGPAGATPPADPAALQLLQLAERNQELRRHLLDRPRLSNVMRHIVREWRAAEPETFTQSTFAERAAGAAQRIAQHKTAKEKLDRIERGLGLRISTAHHFLGLRRFVKLDSIDYFWPEVAQHLRKDLAGIRSFESNVVDPDQRTEELSPLWQKLLKDDQLTGFLRLRPYLRDIYADQLKEYLALSASVVAPGEAVPAAPVAAAEISPTAAPYVPTELLIAAGTEAHQYDVSLTAQGRTETCTVTFDPQCVQMMTKPPETVYMVSRQAPGSTAESADGMMRGDELTTRLRETGSELYDLFFQDRVDAMMMDLLREGIRRRFLLNMPSQLARLPWEALYALPFKLFVGLTNRYSLVRVVPQPTPQRLRPFISPLRIVAVFASPQNLAPLQVEQEADLLQRTLAPATRRGVVALDVLRGEAATVSEVQRMLRIRRPHIFHFSGHGTFLEGAEGALVFEGPAQVQTVRATEMATLLRDNDVHLAVLSGCDTGSSSSADLSTGVAGSLAYAGVPAVIGSMRPILDDAALLFTREFYRAMVDGYTIEESLIEARKAQSLERWDWPALALFSSGAAVLDDLRIELPRE